MISIFHTVASIIKSPLTYFIIAIIILFFGSGRKYINISGIFSNYLNKFIKDQIFLAVNIFISPLMFAISINLSHQIDKDMIELILVIISILMSLFFTFLSHFDDKKDKESSINCNYNNMMQKKHYFEETKAVASYEILISVFIMMCCFINSFIEIGVLIYYLLFHLLINLLVLLKCYNSSI